MSNSHGDTMNSRHLYIPVGVSSHKSKSVFPISGAKFALAAEKQKMYNGKSNKKSVEKDNEKIK